MSLPFPLFPPSASSVATEMDLLYLFIAAVCAFFTVLVAALVVYFAIKYRRRHPDEVGADIHGSLSLELTWTFIPFVLSMVMFVWGAYAVLPPGARRPPTRWTSSSSASSGCGRCSIRTACARSTRCTCRSAATVRITLGSEDVLHDYSIPAFRVKMDVVPGKLTTLWFEATEPGTYHIFCAEYCGTKHSGMIGEVIAMTPQDYEAWLRAAAASTGTAAQNGERLFTDLACITCHKADSTGRGPSLHGVFGSTVELADGRKVIADENYLRESIMNSQAKIVKGYQPHHAGVPGHGERREPDAAHRVHQDAEAGAQRRGAEASRDDVMQQRRTQRQQLSRRAVRHRVVAPDQGPQAHRDAVPDLDHDLLRDRRPVRAGHPARAADAARATCWSPDTYNKLFTLHGVVMIFFFLIPSIPATLGNFLIPIMCGTKDLAFPRINLLSWYLYVIGGILALGAVAGGGLDTGWTFYTPYSTQSSTTNVTLAAMGVFIAGFSSILTGFNFIVTVHRMRAPGLTWFRLPLFVWAQYATSLVMILGTPVIAITLVLVMAERTLGLGDLRSEARRRPGAVPAPVLVLLAPGRLHHDPAGHGRRSASSSRPCRASRSSATPSSRSRASRSRSSASSSGATTCSSAASRSTRASCSRSSRCSSRCRPR